jgi:CBS domain-containing protein
MDTAPYTADQSASIQRVYRYFRTMGLRHLTILDQHHVVVGIITRQDIVEHRLEHHSFDEDGSHFQKYVAVDNSNPRVVYENKDVIVYSGNLKDAQAVRQSAMSNRDRESLYYSNPFENSYGSSNVHTRESLAQAQQEQLMDAAEVGHSAMIMRRSNFSARADKSLTSRASNAPVPSVLGRDSAGTVGTTAATGTPTDLKAPTNSTTSRINREPKGADNQW